MDAQLKAALDFANYSHTLTIQKKVLKERAAAKLTYGFNGGLFKIDQTLLTFVELLCGRGRVTGTVLMDANVNPILIADLTAFRDEIFSRYFEVTNEYLAAYQKIKASRSVSALIAP